MQASAGRHVLLPELCQWADPLPGRHQRPGQEHRQIQGRHQLEGDHSPSLYTFTCTVPSPFANFLQMYLCLSKLLAHVCLPQTSCKCTSAFHKLLANVPMPSTNFLQMYPSLPQISCKCASDFRKLLILVCLPQTSCWCTSAFRKFLQMYLYLPKLFANVALHSQTFCKCTSAFSNFLQMYVPLPSQTFCKCTSAFPNFLQIYVPLPSQSFCKCTSALSNFWQKYLCFHKFFFALESDSYFSSRKVTFFSGSGWGFLKHRLFVSWIPT